MILMFLAGLLPARPAVAASDRAVIILAQGGSPLWTRAVKRVVKAAKLPCPHVIFFGLGDTMVERTELQEDVLAMEGKGAHTIIVVPLLVSPFSKAARQWKYLFGVDVQPGFINIPLFPLEKHATIQFSDPLNDSAAAMEILLDRAHEISSQPAKESVVIVANGPNDESDNRRWGRILQSLSEGVQKRGGYATVEGVTLREDAPSVIRRQSIQALRDRVEAIDREGRQTLIVLNTLTSDGLENRVDLELRGLNFALNTKALMPDSRLSEWIRSQVP
jgi:hypothetical protein